MAITKFNCQCGNQDTKKAIEYSGAMGYEAIVCKECGSYCDHDGMHEADSWSTELAGISKEDAQCK